MYAGNGCVKCPCVAGRCVKPVHVLFWTLLSTTCRRHAQHATEMGSTRHKPCTTLVRSQANTSTHATLENSSQHKQSSVFKVKQESFHKLRKAMRKGRLKFGIQSHSAPHSTSPSLVRNSNISNTSPLPCTCTCTNVGSRSLITQKSESICIFLTMLSLHPCCSMHNRIDSVNLALVPKFVA